MQRALLCIPFLAIVALFFISSESFAADLKTTKVQGITVSDTTANIMQGGCGSDPYQALRPFISGGNVIPTNNGGSLQNGIDPALACRLSKFLAHAAQVGCPAKITSAYRSFAQQQSMCGRGRSGCAPAGSSCHQYGLAVDLSSDCGGRLRSMAGQFNLTFPYYGIHVQCAEHRGASRRSCNRPCDGGAAIATDGSGAPPPSGGSPQSLADAFKQALGLDQPPPPPPPQSLSNMPLLPFFPLPPATTTATSTATTTVKEYIPSKADQESALEKLGKIANIEKVTETTATTVPIVVSGKDATWLSGNPANSTDTAPPPTGAIVPRATETFTSGISYQGHEETSNALALLADMRANLVRTLETLRPFGLRGIPFEGAAAEHVIE